MAGRACGDTQCVRLEWTCCAWEGLQHAAGHCSWFGVGGVGCVKWPELECTIAATVTIEKLLPRCALAADRSLMYASVMDAHRVDGAQKRQDSTGAANKCVRQTCRALVLFLRAAWLSQPEPRLFFFLPACLASSADGILGMPEAGRPAARVILHGRCPQIQTVQDALP
jgi:hypothetical protein